MIEGRRRPARAGGMNTMKHDELVAKLKAEHGLGLVSIVLYGSAVAGDHVGRRSDYNVLVVLERLGVTELDRIAPIAQAWSRAGNPPPLLFTRERLAQSADVFPLELLDIQEHHVVLHGSDVVAPMVIAGTNARLELERELKSKLIALRERYLLTGGRPRVIAQLIADSVSTFLTLGRAAVRLIEGRAPAAKRAAIDPLASRLRLDGAVLHRALDAKEGRAPIRAGEAREFFVRYLQAIETLVEGVDALVPDGR